MGKVRTEIVKRTAAKLIQRYPTRFTNIFDDNKKSVQELLNFESKRLRNLIAGYATRLKCTEAIRASISITDEAQDSMEEQEQ